MNVQWREWVQDLNQGEGLVKTATQFDSEGGLFSSFFPTAREEKEAPSAAGAAAQNAWPVLQEAAMLEVLSSNVYTLQKSHDGRHGRGRRKWRHYRLQKFHHRRRKGHGA